MEYLLDTCVLSEFVKTHPEAAVLKWMAAQDETRLYMSALVLAELHRGVLRMPHSRRRQALTDWLQSLEASFEGRILPFTQRTALRWGELQAAAEARGTPLAAFDSLIAASALEHGLALVTRNERDFAAASIALVNPWAGV